MTNDFDDLSQYFFLKKRINKTYERIRYFKERFNSKNFYTCIQERNGEITTVAFNVEWEVVNHVTGIEKAEQHIEIMRFKQKHFKRFMQSLSPSERQYLVSRYKHDEPILNERLDRLLQEEVAEIEEAAGYRFDKEQPEQKINFNPFEEEGKFEDSFSKMLELLGV